MLERKKSLELKKHVGFIHSTNKLSLLQRKIANALLYNAYDDLLEKDEYEINIGALCQLIGYDSNDHKRIKTALVNLLSTVLEWNLVDGDRINTDGVWNASSIIADASIDGSLCTYSYSNKMKKLLYHPEMYGRINMLVQSQFQSSYGLALYENCIRYQDIGQTPWFDLAKFRKLMGVEESKYKIFRDFKYSVIEKAVNEVNKYSPINVSVQLRKKMRQVVAIQFLIKKVSAGSHTLELLNSDVSLKLSEVLKDTYGLSKKHIEEVISTYPDNFIREKIAMIEQSPSFQTGKIKNLAKYLLCALKDDYQPTKTSKSKQHDTRGKEEPKKVVPRDEKEYRERQKQIIECFNNQVEAKKIEALKKFEKSLKGTYIDIYYRDGLENFLIQQQLCLFVKEKMPELLLLLEDICLV